MNYNYKFEMFIDSLKNKTVSFLGLGISHINVIKMLAKHNIKITVRDKKNIDDIPKDLVKEMLTLNIKFILGENYLDDFFEDIVFRTPGMNFNKPIFKQLHANGVIVTSEMEVFFNLCPCKIIGITGSDGKTTTSTLISEILKTQGYTVHLGGNIGKALLPLIEQITPKDFAVVELSSFQLISMQQSPNIAVITNISPNHLDVHKNIEEYISAKKNIFIHQNSFSSLVLNYNNNITKSFIDDSKGLVKLFSTNTQVKCGAFIDENNDIYAVKNNKKTFLFNSSKILLPGKHNIENYLAAIATTYEYVESNIYLKVASTFKGVEHRIELVKNINGVKWFNDSIATSPSRTIAGLNSFNQKVILIAGGYDKHIPYQPLAPFILNKVSTLILLGATSEKIFEAVTDNENYNTSKINIVKVKGLQEAVETAKKISQPGDIVLMSPASASFDCYKNFEERGKHFKNLVQNLTAKNL